MNKKRDIVKKKYQDLLTLLDFGYTGSHSFCCTAEKQSEKQAEEQKENATITHDSLGKQNYQSIQSLKKMPSPLEYDSALCFTLQKNQAYSFGCGDPVSSANLQKGERILDLGCGCGNDAIRAARILDTYNHCNFIDKKIDVIGIDMIPDMLLRAKKLAKAENFHNIKFIEAYMEDLPFNDNTFDVIISNCVINLSYDKAKVFQETYRVLRKQEDRQSSFGQSTLQEYRQNFEQSLGCGITKHREETFFYKQNMPRVLFSDVVSENSIPYTIEENNPLQTKLWGECIGGVISKEDYISLMHKAGFSFIEIIHEQKLSQNYIFTLLPKSCSQEDKEILKTINFYKILLRAFAGNKNEK